MMLRRRTFHRAAAAVAVAIACFGTSGASAQDAYPSRNINWVIPFSPGSGADTFARTLINATHKHLKVRIVPLNKEGGGTAVGVAYALSQPADGYTVFSQSDTLVMSLAAGQMPFSPNDMQAIARINADYKVLAVNKNSPFKTYQEFVDYAKKNPGKIKIGGVGSKSWSSVFVQKLSKGAGMQLTYVPYDGGSQVVSAISGENLDAVVVTSSNINAQADSGDIRMLAISLGQRAPDRPNVPTFKEVGQANIDEDLLWRGVFAKAGVPADVIATFQDALSKALKDKSWTDYMERERQQPAFLGAAEFDKQFKESVAEAKAAL
jgi:tripartite-type tricarboxylate transporter receptor subunit TctC